MRKDYRTCDAAAAFNTGFTPCPLQPDKITGIILVQHGYKLPTELTAESLLKACHANYPERIYPITGIVEYAPNGGEANTSATGYGPNKITGYSARTDTFTLDKYNMSLLACTVRAKAAQFDMYPYDVNNVIYGMDDGTDQISGIPLSGIYPTGQPYTSSGQTAYIAFNAMLQDVEKYMANATVCSVDFDLSSTLRGLSFVEFAQQGKATEYKLIEHFERLDMTPYYGKLLQGKASSILEGEEITALSYDENTGIITVTGSGTPRLKSAEELFEQDIIGIEQWM